MTVEEFLEKRKFGKQFVFSSQEARDLMKSYAKEKCKEQIEEIWHGYSTIFCAAFSVKSKHEFDALQRKILKEAPRPKFD